MPMSEERSNLRLSIIPQLLEVVSYNKARQNDSLAFYEVGSVFLTETGEELPREEEHIAGALDRPVASSTLGKARRSLLTSTWPKGSWKACSKKSVYQKPSHSVKQP